MQAYSRYVAAVYASRFDSYAGEQFKVLGQQQIKHGTLIKTQIIKSNGEPVAIKSGNVTIEGIFETLDEQGCMIVRTPEGRRIPITAGDVHFGSVASARAT